jgi:hypothetical protein
MRALQAIVALAIICLLTGSATASAQQTRSGALEVTVADDFADEEATTSYRLRTEDGTVPVLPTRLSTATSGDRVEVTGQMQDGYLVGPIQTVGTAEAMPSGVRKVAVVRLRYEPDESEEEALPESILRERVFTAPDSANSFYQAATHGQISLAGVKRTDGDVFGPYTIQASERCGVQQHAADEQAAEEGVALSEYDNVIYVVPDGGCTLNVGALGEVGGRRSIIYGIWLGLEGARSFSQTIAHELGHNLGLSHAHALECIDEERYLVPFSDNCSLQEYGDGFDVMGNGYEPFHDWYLRDLGVLEQGNVMSIDSSGTYRVHAGFHGTPETIVLRIPRSWNSRAEPAEWYDLEYRDLTNPFERPSYAERGVLIHTSPSDGGSSTLLYAADGRYNANGEPWLPPPHTFTDGGLHITALQVGNGEATVKVELSLRPDLLAPTPPGAPSATAVGLGVNLEWAPSHDDDSGLGKYIQSGVGKYIVRRDGNVVGTSSTTSFKDPAVAPGPHVYTVYAEDLSNNVSSSSPPIVFDMPDSTPPSAPGPPSAWAGSEGVSLEWGASSDNIGVSDYLVFRDGVEVGATTELSFLDPDPPPGVHAYEIYAEDANNGLSAPSEPATVEVLDRRSPTTPSSPSATVAPGGVFFDWVASEDDVGVSRYVVFRDGFEVGTSASAGFLDRGVSVGPHSYWVYAEDEAGNQSAPSGEIGIVVGAIQAPGQSGPLTSPATVANRQKPRLQLSWRYARRHALIVTVKSSTGPRVVRLELWVNGRQCADELGPELVARCQVDAESRSDNRLTVRATTQEGARRIVRRTLPQRGDSRR